MVFDLLRKSLKTMVVATVVAGSAAIFAHLNPQIISEIANPMLRTPENRARIIIEMQKKAEQRVRVQISNALDRKSILRFLWGGKLFLYKYIEDRTVDEIQGLIASENVYAKLIVPPEPLTNLDKFRIGVYWLNESREYFLVSLKAKWHEGSLDVDLSEPLREESGLPIYVDYLSRFVELIATKVYEEEIKGDLSKLRSDGRDLLPDEEQFLKRYLEVSQEMKQYITYRNKTLLDDVLRKFLVLRDEVGRSMVSHNTRFKQSLFSLLDRRVKETGHLLERF